MREETERASRFAREREKIEGDLAAMSDAGAAEDLDALQAEQEAAVEASEEAEERAASAREALALARDAETRARGPLGDAERKAQRLETEMRTLAKLFATASAGVWPPMLDRVPWSGVSRRRSARRWARISKPRRTPRAPAHWAELDGAGDPPPPGVAVRSQGTSPRPRRSPARSRRSGSWRGRRALGCATASCPASASSRARATSGAGTAYLHCGSAFGRRPPPRGAQSPRRSGAGGVTGARRARPAAKRPRFRTSRDPHGGIERIRRRRGRAAGPPRARSRSRARAGGAASRCRSLGDAPAWRRRWPASRRAKRMRASGRRRRARPSTSRARPRTAGKTARGAGARSPRRGQLRRKRARRYNR